MRSRPGNVRWPRRGATGTNVGAFSPAVGLAIAAWIGAPDRPQPQMAPPINVMSWRRSEDLLLRLLSRHCVAS